MRLPSRDFKSLASTNFATQAKARADCTGREPPVCVPRGKAAASGRESWSLGLTSTGGHATQFSLLTPPPDACKDGDNPLTLRDLRA